MTFSLARAALDLRHLIPRECEHSHGSSEVVGNTLVMRCDSCDKIIGVSDECSVCHGSGWDEHLTRTDFFGREHRGAACVAPGCFAGYVKRED